MNGPFRDTRWRDSFKKTDHSTIERRWMDPLWTNLGWTDQKATWHLTNNYVVSKKS